MAEKIYDIKSNPYSGQNDLEIIIPLNADNYLIHVDYSDFVPGASTGFKLQRSARNNPENASFVDMSGSSVIIDDANGVIEYENEKAEKARFLRLVYTSDGNDASSKFNIWLGRD